MADREVKLRYRIDFLNYNEDGSFTDEHSIYVEHYRAAELAAETMTRPGRLVSYTEEEIPCR